MAQNLRVCVTDEQLKQRLKKFRFRKEKTNGAVVMKIDQEAMTVIQDPNFEDEELEDISLGDLAEQLPAHQPRYVAYSYCYTHDDGRVSYPLCFIFISPAGCKPEQQMMYAGSKNNLVQDGDFTKVFELRSSEEMTEDWLKSKLKFFK